jgi:hypothetical protein
MKKWLAGIWLLVLTIIVGSFFWYNQFVYSLPTPVPANYRPISTGAKVDLRLPVKVNKEKPTLLHFFNPDCPCSRFNIKEFKSLAKEYADDMNFVVVMITDKPYSVEEVQKRFDFSVPVVKDQEYAKNCGVYSTPQAVVINTKNELFYRGNYNKSRYCMDEETRYVKQAVKNLLLNQNTKLDAIAFKAYGCSAPNCTN